MKSSQVVAAWKRAVASATNLPNSSEGASKRGHGGAATGRAAEGAAEGVEGGADAAGVVLIGVQTKPEVEVVTQSLVGIIRTRLEAGGMDGRLLTR